MINVDTPTEFIDVFPTLCELAELEVPKELDGISLRPQILGEQTTSKIFAVSQYPRGGNMNGYVMGYSFRTKRHRYTVWVNNKKSSEPIYVEDIYAEELYDYMNDPLETENIIDDSDQQRIKTTFQTLAARFFNSQIVNEPEPIVNEPKTNIPKPSPNNKWANQRSKTISQYVSSEMKMNKNQLKFLQQVLYDKYARNNEMTAEKNYQRIKLKPYTKKIFQ